MIDYRSFHNDDPPGLMEIWNDAFSGRGAVQMANPSPLDSYVFSKPYFDPAGLILAVEDGRRVGFTHAGFGVNADQKTVSPAVGVLCAVAVRQSHRYRGIGSELLRRGEDYLRSRGATALRAGPAPPLNPFYFGLYGGSDQPGFLASDAAADPFLKRHGYTVHDNRLVLQRRLDRLPGAADPRFVSLRRRFELQAEPPHGTRTWWQECVLGPIELFQFRLEDKESGQAAARADVWEMEGYRWRWNEPVAGIRTIEVREDLRRQGLAKLLLVQLLRQLQEQYFTLVEVQVREADEPAVRLFRGLGFEQVDLGRHYAK